MPPSPDLTKGLSHPEIRYSNGNIFTEGSSKNIFITQRILEEAFSITGYHQCFHFIPLKTPEKQKSSVVFRRDKMGISVRNG